MDPNDTASVALKGLGNACKNVPSARDEIPSLVIEQTGDPETDTVKKDEKAIEYIHGSQKYQKGVHERFFSSKKYVYFEVYLIYTYYESLITNAPCFFAGGWYYQCSVCSG
jgi:hypothetical protein